MRVIRKNKNPPRKREREYSFFFWWKKDELNGRNYIKFIQNKMERRIVKI